MMIIQKRRCKVKLMYLFEFNNRGELRRKSDTIARKTFSNKECVCGCEWATKRCTQKSILCLIYCLDYVCFLI